MTYDYRNIKLMKKITSIVSLLLIIGCGSNSSPSLIEPPQLPEVPDTILPMFNVTPIILEDGVSYYSNACNNPSFQFLIPVNINDDIYTDFIAHFWCDSENPTEISKEDVPDSLIAYVSDGYGNYNIDNVSVFGELYPKLGGASRKYARGDINEDGKDDFAFAMNAEDGRAAYDWETYETNYAYPAVLLSTNSGYEIINIGNKDWGHSVQIKNNEVLFGGHTSQAYKFLNSEWIDISNNYTELSFASFLVFDDYIVNSSRKDSKQGLELVKNNEVISSIMKDEIFKVYFEAWNNSGTGNYEQIGVYEYRNKYYFHGMTSEMCRKDDLIVATINASKPIEGEIIENGYYSESESTPVVLFSFYEIDANQLKEKDISIDGEEINHNFNFFDCLDVNKDNNKDIVAQVFSQSWNTQSPNNKGIPKVYINSGINYINLDTSEWPTFSINVDSQGFLFDINKSGTVDLIMYPLKADVSANIEIYTSNRNITD